VSIRHVFHVIYSSWLIRLAANNLSQRRQLADVLKWKLDGACRPKGPRNLFFLVAAWPKLVQFDANGSAAIFCGGWRLQCGPKFAGWHGSLRCLMSIKQRK
jgi:hypothetical protein